MVRERERDEQCINMFNPIVIFILQNSIYHIIICIKLYAFVDVSNSKTIKQT